MAFYPNVSDAVTCGKPSYGSVSDGTQPNSSRYGEKCDPTTPKASVPTGGRQSSGKATHERSGGMNIAGKGENLKNMPTVHTGGGTGSIAGVA